MRILGIEGTAWCASAALYDSESESVFIESEAYEPESGGIDPREAAEHMRTAIPDVIEKTLEHSSGEIDAVAFSRGPGLGPCLRIVGTAARALAQSLDVPLTGVNHMVAHLEIGRHRSGFDAPVCLNASGANAHVLAYRNGRYRVLGETMDTGVGNALDKFTRHVGWSHPGGPKVEAHAKRGEYVPFPYVVKGMDFSFSGIMSAAKQEVDAGTPVEDVCRGLEETIFAMLTEVSERALSLTGRNELVLGGGVGQNARLQEMLAEMCAARGADFFAPEPRFLQDNAGMIAVLGEKMVTTGDTLAIEDSAVNSDFRPDQVPVSWRAPDPTPVRDSDTIHGAEATVTFDDGTVTKARVPKEYRHPELDDRLRRNRTVMESRLTSDARRCGVPTPLVWDVDVSESTITFQRVGDSDLRDDLDEQGVRAVGRYLATIHEEGFVHGDPTTRNVRVTTADDGTTGRVFFIDFGLGYHTNDIEDYAMDCHVFEQSLLGTADDPATLTDTFETGYREIGDASVLEQLRIIEGRGRYQAGPA